MQRTSPLNPVLARTVVAAFFLFAPSFAGANQVTDNFDNPTYDGSYNNTIWDAGGGAATLNQSSPSSSLLMTMPDSNWAASSIASIVSRDTRAPQTAGVPDYTKGTQFSTTVKSFTVTTEGDQWRGGISVDSNVQLFFYDSTGYTNGMFSYNSEAFSVLLYLTNAQNKVAVEVNQKVPGQSGGMGRGIGYRTVDVTFPLQVDVLMNEVYYELRLNGSKVLGGVHNLNRANMNGTSGFQIFSANTNNSRGTITMSAVSVSDRGAATFTKIPDQITEDFASWPQTGKFGTVDGVASAASVTHNATSQTITLNTGDADWAATGLASTDEFPLRTDISEVTTFPATVKAVSFNPTSGMVNASVAVVEYPGNASWSYNPSYYLRGDAGVIMVVLANADGTNASLTVMSKPTGTAYNNGTTLIPGQSLGTITFPATLRLECSASQFDAFVNGTRHASATHTAAFGKAVTAYFAASNQGGGRGSVTFDDFSEGANKVVPVGLVGFSVE